MPVESKKPIVNPKYKVEYSDRLGRYLVAAKDISAGEAILREEPVVVGPIAFSNDRLCFACHRSLSIYKRKVQYICNRCNVAPLCSAACEEHRRYHTIAECDIFQEKGSIIQKKMAQLVGALLPFRLWLLKTIDATLWEKIHCMQSHLDKRKNTQVWRDRQENVVKVLQDLQLVPNDEASANELQEICGILDVNTFELRSPDCLNEVMLRGLYTEAALMAHDCKGNVHLTVDDNFQLAVYACLPIKIGETILFNYTSSLSGTIDRREHLRVGKYFECECETCKDPEEKGAYLSAILCPRCRGPVVMRDPLVVNPFERNTKWQCRNCKRAYSGRLVKLTLEITQTRIDQLVDPDLKDFENLVSSLSTSLHPSHSLLLSVKQKLLAAYRNELTSINPQRKTMQKMLNLCKEVFSVLEIVEPGLSRLKGILLYEMHLPLVLLANRAYSTKEISTIELTSQLTEASLLLKRALTMLLLEPITTPEGQLARRALQEMKLLNQNIEDVKSISEHEKLDNKTKENRKSKR